MPFCQRIAAKDPEVNSESLRRFIRRRKKPKEKAHGNQRFTDAAEEVLVSALRALDAAAMPWDKPTLLRWIRRVFELPPE